MVVEDTGPARLEMVWDGKHGHEETLNHSVILAAFSRRGIDTASAKRSAAEKCMATCGASCRR